jgi:hypothetical protein
MTRATPGSGLVPDTRRLRTTAVPIAIAAGATVVEGALLALSAPVTLGATLAWHVAVVAAAGVWLWRPEYRVTSHGILLLISIAAFGPLGSAGMLLALALERYHARRATSIDEWHAMLYPSAERDEHAALWRRIGQRGHDQSIEPGVTPFLDILTFGPVPQRQAAVAIMAQQFAPAFAPALRAALRDEHNVVRVQAATAIARLEQQFFERTVALEATVLASGDDPDAVLALASEFDNQAFAGLFDPAREALCRTRAADLFARYLLARPDDRTVEFRLARLLLRLGRPVEAEPRFRHLVECGAGSARLWLMECLFVQGRYAELRQVAAGWDTAGGEDEALLGVRVTVDLWSGSEAA